MNELSLFSGYCGITLGLRLALKEVRTIGYCEIDPYCQKVIKARIKDGLLDDAPIWTDICTADFQGLKGLVDIVTGGFPCQDISGAGTRLGLRGKRSSLWFEYLRVIGELRPRYALLENVSDILIRGVPEVLGGLVEIGYDTRWTIVTAAECGAPHLRKRWFCLAYPSEFGCCSSHFDFQQSEEQRTNAISNSRGAQSEERQESAWPRFSKRQPGSWNRWDVAPSRLQHVADRTPEGMAQLGAAGNGVVPAMVARFLRKVVNV